MALFFRQPMRFRSDDAGLTVRAVTGTHAALLALDLAPAARPGLWGFAVHRRRASASSGDWLSNKRHALPQSLGELGLADAGGGVRGRDANWQPTLNRRGWACKVLRFSAQKFIAGDLGVEVFWFQTETGIKGWLRKCANDNFRYDFALEFAYGFFYTK